MYKYAVSVQHYRPGKEGGARGQGELAFCARLQTIKTASLVKVVATMQHHCFLPMQYHCFLPRLPNHAVPLLSTNAVPLDSSFILPADPLLLPENSNYLLKGKAVVVRGDIRLLALPSPLYQQIPQIIGIQEIQNPHRGLHSCAGARIRGDWWA
jgi:hypothetical protein